MPVSEIIFYINVGLAFCTMTELAVTIAMSKKTACMYSACLTAIFALCFGMIAFCVQLFMYSFGNKFAMYAIYAALGILYAGIGTVAVYCFMLSRRSNKGICLLAGIFGFIPPVGTFFTIMLLFRIKSDTPAEELVYNGYAYTFAALGEFCGRFNVDFVDGAEEEQFEETDRTEIRKILRSLKKNKKTDEGKLEYGAALLNYKPKKQKKALKAISKAAKRGYAPAIFNLGFFYEKGLCVNRDLKRAHELYSRAASMGDRDAELRLACIDAHNGLDKLETLAQTDPVAKYDVAVATEKGIGTEKNVDKALELYAQCISLFVAQKRLFALAAEKVNAEDGTFDKVMSIEFDGEFGLMMKGLSLIREKLAADAADAFLSAVKCRGKWEGVARCLVGALYIDNGALDGDRKNGAAYIKSAMPLTSIAADLYKIVPKRIIANNNRQK